MAVQMICKMQISAHVQFQNSISIVSITRKHCSSLGLQDAVLSATCQCEAALCTLQSCCLERLKCTRCGHLSLNVQLLCTGIPTHLPANGLTNADALCKCVSSTISSVELLRPTHNLGEECADDSAYTLQLRAVFNSDAVLKLLVRCANCLLQHHHHQCNCSNK
jgi:hypothetical protein